MPRRRGRETAASGERTATPLSFALPETNARGKKGTARRKTTKTTTVKTKETTTMRRKKNRGERRARKQRYVKRRSVAA